MATRTDDGMEDAPASKKIAPDMSQEKFDQRTRANLPENGFGLGIEAYNKLSPHDKVVAVMEASERNWELIDNTAIGRDMSPPDAREIAGFYDDELVKIGEQNPETGLAQMSEEERLSWANAAVFAKSEVAPSEFDSLKAHPDIATALNEFGKALAMDGNQIQTDQGGIASDVYQQRMIEGAVEFLKAGNDPSQLAGALKEASQSNPEYFGTVPEESGHGLNAITQVADAIAKEGRGGR